MLREISVTEQRYQAVLDGVPVTEVASRFGVGRQSVHRRLARYEAGGLEGLSDQSPWQIRMEQRGTSTSSTARLASAPPTD